MRRPPPGPRPPRPDVVGVDRVARREPRSIDVDPACCLSNEEIVRGINFLHDLRKRGTEITTDMLADGIVVRIAATSKLTREDVITILNNANRAKAHGFADMMITFQDGRIVKSATTIKDSLPHHGRPTGGAVHVGGEPMRDF